MTPDHSVYPPPARKTPSADGRAWVDRLLALGREVRHAIVSARDAGLAMSRPVAEEGGDTIFAIDRHVEPILQQHARHWAEQLGPIELVAEGLGDTGRQRFGPTAGPPVCYVIVDPIDGTRNLMYDKRSAWFIAAAVPGHADPSTLDHAHAAAIVELPPTKAGHADCFAATGDRLTHALRQSLHRDAAVDLPVRPSQAPTLRNGFAQVASFFPGTKVLAATLMERIVDATLGPPEPGSAAVFDDQYISTAGQMVELMLGHDRFCCDLRPLFYAIHEQRTGQPCRGLECHPYDVAGLLVAQRAGVVLTDGLGRPLRPELNVHQPVHWCGYANPALRQRIEPVIQQFFQEHGLG